MTTGGAARPAREEIGSVGSFRDPNGSVIELGGRIFRSVTALGRAEYEGVRDRGLLQKLTGEGRLIASTECSSDERKHLGLFEGADYVLEHPRIETISYPYEWTFSARKAAALFHLQLHCDLLEQSATLRDASAYNVQFVGTSPIFIDLLSLAGYQDGEYWLAHTQFCEQFLNPLLLHAKCGVEPNAWFRGRLEGISTESLARLLPVRSRLSLATQANVFLPATLQARERVRGGAASGTPAKKLPKIAYLRILRQLQAFIEGLELPAREITTWQNYGAEPGYDSADQVQKRAFVAEFCAATKPKLLLDLGCNTGDYTELALKSGALRAIGVDADHGAADAAFRRARAAGLAMNVLFIDLANESPAQGWWQTERRGFSGRYAADAVLALALVHHLALGRNVPLDSVVSWIVSQAPAGIIEFPAASDPQVAKLVRFKPDVLAGYTLDAFLAAVTRRAQIVKTLVLEKSGRTLVRFGPK